LDLRESGVGLSARICAAAIGRGVAEELACAYAAARVLG
jgi:hypothetical protein